MRNTIDRTETSEAKIFIEAARGVVRRNAFSIPLSRREREVTVALALADRPLSAREIGTLLWPDADAYGAANLAKVFVYRVRRRIALDFVVSRDGGYGLGRAVRIDASEARSALLRLTGCNALIPAMDRARLLDLATSLRAEPPIALAEREWFAATGLSLRRSGRDLAILIARNALAFGLDDDALRIGRALSYEDPCDEEAWELIIISQLRGGDTAGAVQSFRCYERALAAELQAVPSSHLRSLVSNVAPCDTGVTPVRPIQNGRSDQRVTVA